MEKRIDPWLKFVVIFMISVFAASSFYVMQILAAEGTKLERAMWYYQHENFEEALVLFKELRQEEPNSSNIAYYLGVTYKQLQDYPAARPHLEAATALQPPAKNALPELIDLLYQMDKTEEAKERIAQAERESVTPAQTAFFKGLISLKEGKDADAAIASFEQAEKLDESLAGAVKYYKAMAYMQSKNYAAAKSAFREIVVKEPTADLAMFANEYIDAISRSEKATKPFRGNINYALQYDDNVILKPGDENLSVGIGNEEDWRQTVSAQAELNAKPTDLFGIRGGYSFYGAKQFDLGFYDTVSHDFYAHPTVYLKKATVAFPIHYNWVSVNDKDYIETLGFSNMDNLMLGRDQMLQGGFQYNVKDYKWAVTTPNENRDAREYAGSAGWFYFFGRKQEGFFNLRYAMNYEDTKGSNWTYFGNRVTASAVIPVIKKVKYSFVGDYFHQHFMKTNTVYEKKRYDDVFTASNLLAFEIIKDMELQLSYTYVTDYASIGVYKYDRNMYSAGVKYEF